VAGRAALVARVAAAGALTPVFQPVFDPVHRADGHRAAHRVASSKQHQRGDAGGDDRALRSVQRRSRALVAHAAYDPGREIAGVARAPVCIGVEQGHRLGVEGEHDGMDADAMSPSPGDPAVASPTEWSRWNGGLTTTRSTV